MAEPLDDDADYTLGIEAVVMDGEFEGTPVSDYLNIQESKNKPGELYVSKKSKTGATTRNVLSIEEYNTMVDRMNEVEETRKAWIPVLAEAINNAANPVFRSVIVQNEPKDETNKRNKLTKKPEEIGPYVDPVENQKILETRDQIADNGNGSKKRKTTKKAKKEEATNVTDEEVDATIPESSDLKMK